MARESLMDLYRHSLNDLYDAEQQILKALPKMADKAGHEELRAAFNEHERVTRKHVNRLEQVFKGLNEPAQAKPCRGMRGLLAEGEETMKEHQNSDVLDAALIAAAQKVEHYEMAAYGCARTYAETLGFSDQAVLLQQTLDEEGEADKRLTALAEGEVNPDALAA